MITITARDRVPKRSNAPRTARSSIVSTDILFLVLPPSAPAEKLTAEAEGVNNEWQLDQSPSEKTNVMSFIFCSGRVLIFCCSWKVSIRTPAYASAGGAENKVNFKPNKETPLSEPVGTVVVSSGVCGGGTNRCSTLGGQHQKGDRDASGLTSRLWGGRHIQQQLT